MDLFTTSLKIFMFIVKNDNCAMSYAVLRLNLFDRPVTDAQIVLSIDRSVENLFIYFIKISSYFYKSEMETVP